MLALSARSHTRPHSHPCSSHSRLRAEGHPRRELWLRARHLSSGWKGWGRGAAFLGLVGRFFWNPDPALMRSSPGACGASRPTCTELHRAYRVSGLSSPLLSGQSRRCAPHLRCKQIGPECWQETLGPVTLVQCPSKGMCSQTFPQSQRGRKSA